MVSAARYITIKPRPTVVWYSINKKELLEQIITSFCRSFGLTPLVSEYKNGMIKKLRINSLEQGTLQWKPNPGLFWYVQLWSRV